MFTSIARLMSRSGSVLSSRAEAVRRPPARYSGAAVDPVAVGLSRAVPSVMFAVLRMPPTELADGLGTEQRPYRWCGFTPVAAGTEGCREAETMVGLPAGHRSRMSENGVVRWCSVVARHRRR
ncbi:hypothetical protein GCM10027280_09520 [Micromonospora polyrhachis]